MIGDDALAAHALARGLATAAQLDQARARLAILRKAGLPGDLLGVLAPALSADALAALRIAAGAGAAPDGHTGVVAPAAPAAPPAAQRLPATALRPGDRVGPYVLRAELGRGGMGAVYAAEHVDLHRVVALKVQLSTGGGARAALRFGIEARAAAGLKHPGIVPVHDAGRDEQGRPWMAMGLVEGEGLDRRLERGGPLDPLEAARIGAAVANAVQAAHAQGVLHRDLKPANVLIRARDGAALVTDFGLAKVLDGAESLTKTGELLGTPHYMAPEQASGGEVGPPVDVWALGATLYAMLVGRSPFHGISGLLPVLAAVASAPIEPPRALRPDVPAALDAIVMRCLERDRGRRYATMADVAADLERLLRGESTEAGAAASSRSRRRAALVVAGALTLGALASGAVALLRHPTASATSATSLPPNPTPTVAPTPSAAITAAADSAATVARDPKDEEDDDEDDDDRGPLPVVDVAGADLIPDDTWARCAKGPGPRINPAMAWDGARRAVVLHGGHIVGTSYDDEWLFDGAGWKPQPATPRPPARYGHVLAWDAARGKLVLHGGALDGQTGAVFDTVWERDEVEGWQEHRASGGPGKRAWHCMVYDPKRARLVLFGGADKRLRGHADLWTWDGTRWTALPPGPAPAPSGRHLFAAAWDATRDALLVVGGFDAPARSEAWEWNPDRGWSLLDPAGGPGPRMGAALAAYPGGVLFHGGMGETRVRGDTLVRIGGAWQKRCVGVPHTVMPRGREWHAAAWDEARGFVVLFGGEGRGDVFGDTWRFKPGRGD